MPLLFSRSDHVGSTCENGVLRITIRRPEKRNPLSLGVLEAIRQEFTRHAEDDGIGFAILTSEGDQAFASGGDLDELMAFRDAEDGKALSLHGKAALDAIRTFPVPVVARINGVALGGGAELALACDMRVATASAKIGFIHGRLNIAPSWGGGIDLVRLVGPAKATRLLTQALILDARQALDMGLIDAHSSDNASFDSKFEDFISPLRRQSPQVMRAIKSLNMKDRAIGRAEADEAETRHFAYVWAHQDHWNAVAALGGKKS